MTSKVVEFIEIIRKYPDYLGFGTYLFEDGWHGCVSFKTKTKNRKIYREYGKTEEEALENVLRLIRSKRDPYICDHGNGD
jgi:hypothetical protein